MDGKKKNAIQRKKPIVKLDKPEIEILSPDDLEIPEEEMKKIMDKFKDDNPGDKIGFIMCKQEVHEGPLPSPRDLEKYNQIIPNGAERIMKMAEKQSAHRIEMEKVAINGEVKQSGRGQNYGFTLAIILILIATLLALTGHEAVACIIGGTTIVSLCTVFVVGKTKK